MEPVEVDADDNETSLQMLIDERLSSEHKWAPFFHGNNAEVLRSMLTERLNGVNAALASKNAELSVLQAQCFAEGPEGKKRWFDAKAEHDEWRRRTLIFKRMLDARISETKRASEKSRLARADSGNELARKAMRDVVRQLAVAVAEHQRECVADGQQASAADMRLWDTLDQITIPFGTGTATLSDMVDSTWATS